MRTLITALGLILVMTTSTLSREPMVEPDDMVPVELATVGVDPLAGSPLVLLREAGSGDVVPISIGPVEAQAILRAIESVATPRPMTHDTMALMIREMGGQLERIMVDGLVDNSYYGILDIRLDDAPDTPVFVDTRPSDGLALAVRTGASILVAPDVLQSMEGQAFEGLSDDQMVTALGITVAPATDDIRAQLDLPDDPGLVVTRAVGAAREQGVEARALLLSVNGEIPENPMAFLHLIQETEDGENATIRYWLDGEERSIELDTNVPDGEHRQPRDRDDRPQV